MFNFFYKQEFYPNRRCSAYSCVLFLNGKGIGGFGGLIPNKVRHCINAIDVGR